MLRKYVTLSKKALKILKTNAFTFDRKNKNHLV